MENKELFGILKNHKEELRRKYHISKIGIFGSYARGEETAESDIDILVEYEKSPGFFEFLDLEESLEKILNKKIDLVTKPALKEIIKNEILDEVIYV
jgi:uncharacterized protein